MESVVVDAWAGAYLPKDGQGEVPAWKRVFNTLLNAWIWLGSKIGHVMSYVLLTVIYFIVVGPLHFYLRATGNKIMDLEMEKSRPTLWTPSRSANRPERDGKQY